MGLISVYELYTRQWPITSIIGFILGCYAIAGIAGDDWPTLPDETEATGWMLPGSLPTPTTNCFPNTEGLEFIAGGNIVKLNTSVTRAVLLQIDDTIVLYMEKEGDKLYFTANIFD